MEACRLRVAARCRRAKQEDSTSNLIVGKVRDDMRLSTPHEVGHES